MTIEELELLTSNYPPEKDVLFTLGEHISMNYVLAFPVEGGKTVMLELCNLDDIGVSQGLPDNLDVVDKDYLAGVQKILASVVKCRQQDLLATKLETEGDPDGKLGSVLNQLDQDADELMALIDKHIEGTR